MSKESTSRTLLVALVLCLVCSVFVSAAAVVLKPKQTEARVLDRKKNILAVAGLVGDSASREEINRKFEAIELRVVDLETGEYTDAVDAARYDQFKAARSADGSDAVPAEKDIASIKRRERLATVYLVKDDEAVSLYVLPVRGYGLWSTLYGFLAVEPDGRTVRGLRFYQHAETPGLGGEVDNPKWRELWHGRKLFDESGLPRIEVVKGGAREGDPDAHYKVDALAGATLTSRGVNNLIHYWIGEEGFKPFLSRLQQAAGTGAVQGDKS